MKSKLSRYLIPLALLLLCITACNSAANDPSTDTSAAGTTTTTMEQTTTTAHEHAFGEWAVVKNASCTEKGEQQRVCACGETELQDIEILSHTEVTDAAVAPTCTKTGLTEGKHCSVCNTVTLAQTSIPATGHIELTNAAKAATCTETGLTESKQCTVCNTVTLAPKTVPATGHTEVTDAAVAATCTQTGLTEGKHCSVCNTVLVAQETLETVHAQQTFAGYTLPTATEEGLTCGLNCALCGFIIQEQQVLPVNHPDGLLIYYNDFQKYANSADTAKVLEMLGWRKLTVAGDGVYNETDGEFAIVDGRLYFDNYDAEAVAGDTRVRGKEGYYAIDALNDDIMRRVVGGRYTLQYDLEYTAASNYNRYACFATECSTNGKFYTTFNLRVRGNGYHQVHTMTAYVDFSAYDPAIDLNPKSTKHETQGTTILKKLLGKDFATYGSEMNFLNVPVTIRLQWDPAEGHHVYMKTADMTDFVKVSQPDTQNASGSLYLHLCAGWSVRFKLGGAIDGYIDNVALWTGWGEMPQKSS